MRVACDVSTDDLVGLGRLPAALHRQTTIAFVIGVADDLIFLRSFPPPLLLRLFAVAQRPHHGKPRHHDKAATFFRQQLADSSL
jgi:hypothetical protein